MNDDDKVKELKNWQKYEQFNFVLDETNDFFYDLRIYFAFMKESYLTINNICSESNNTDLIKLILDQNYGLLGERYKR